MAVVHFTPEHTHSQGWIRELEGDTQVHSAEPGTGALMVANAEDRGGRLRRHASLDGGGPTPLHWPLRGKFLAKHRQPHCAVQNLNKMLIPQASA